MEKDIKTELKNNGQSLRWFYDKFIKGKVNLTYSGFTAQLNGYAPVNETVKNAIYKYMGDK